MPIFFQQDIDADTRLAVWKIEEDEAFFLKAISIQREITHPHKRLQHLAGRYLLKYLFPDFPLSLIQIADTRKPFLEDEAFHFSISHCSDYAAVIVSAKKRVGIDIEVPNDKVLRITHKFLHQEEQRMLPAAGTDDRRLPATILWSAKEALFKWWGHGQVDFSEMLRISGAAVPGNGKLKGRFIKNGLDLPLLIHFRTFSQLVLAWVETPADIIHQRGA